MRLFYLVLLILTSSCLEKSGKLSLGNIVIPNETELPTWLTQLGAVTTAAGGDNSGNDICLGVSVDGSGNVYCAGYTHGDLGESNGGSSDAFVMKLRSRTLTQDTTIPAPLQ